MKRIRVIARERIIDPSTMRIHTDAGLMALNGYWENVYEVDDDYSKTSFILDLEDKVPELRGRNFQIIELD